MAIEETLKKLAAPLAAHLIKHRDGDKKGSFQLAYVEWATVADILDQYAPGWSFEIIQLDSFGEDTVLCRGKLTIEGVSRENVGAATMQSFQTLENTLKDAASDCLKRCAILFGVGRELYIKDAPEPHSSSQPRANPMPKNPVAKVMPTTAPPSDLLKLVSDALDAKKFPHVGARKAYLMEGLELRAAPELSKLTVEQLRQLLHALKR